LSRNFSIFVILKTKSLKIAVNTRLLLKNKLEGIGWFIYETMKRITRAHPEHEFFFIFDRKYDDSFIFSTNVTPFVAGIPARHPFLHYLWYEHSIPAVLNRIKPDVFISPDGYCSLKTGYKTLIVIHDLNFEHYPGNMPWLPRKYYRYFTPRYARKAERIATVSQYSKQDISEQYGIDPQKIDVVFNGASNLFTPVSLTKKSEIKNRFTYGNDFFVFIGALNPRKNLANLFRAFDIFKEKTGSSVRLVIIGEKMWWTNDIKSSYNSMKYSKDVVFTGRLGMPLLTEVVGSALALTYVSVFEGFGIPILEAFKSEIPVITSNITSMPEVAAGAALFADPFKPKSIAEAMIRIYSDQGLREELVAKGKKRQQDFSWDITADRLWESVTKIVG